MISDQIVLWAVFNIAVLLMLFFDLGVFHRKNHVIGLKESIAWSVIWIVVALIFNVGVYIWSGPVKGTEFLTVYIIERSLSIDNIFVFLIIFQYFRVAGEFQYKVLFWGILGALVMRAVFIVSGVALVNKFHWMIYVFGALLVYVGLKLAFKKGEEVHPENNIVLKLCKKILPVSDGHEGGKFFLRKGEKLFVTPLFLVLIVIETSDIIFAVDSIPAALAITRDSFIIYSANVFAILGLRATYFALEGFMRMFRYLNYGLSVVLTFVGAKMLISDFYHIQTVVSLAVIAAVLAVSVVLSVFVRTKNGKK
ncbi:MAG: TerC family protein [Endomicrobiales bacterium]|nr:TerC family protein [Endomicrobiales bacterium]